jgi:NAD(P)-dependent dehydrogenase (short-subunit alcohol dehydrogenase family)
LACRTASTAEEALVALKAINPNVSAEFVPLDLGDLDNVRKFGAIVKQKREAGEIPPITIILANAGGQYVKHTETKQGFEATIGINVLGHFLLLHLLLKLVDPKHPTRIIITASGTHDPAEKTGMPDPAYTSPHKMAFPEEDSRDPTTVGTERYSTSKLCNVLQTYELAKRMASVQSLKNVTVNAIDPGLMFGTGLGRDRGKIADYTFKNILPWATPLARMFISNVRTMRESATSLATLATSKEFEGVNAKYFQQTRAIPSSRDSYDENKQRELWEESVKLVGLKQNETVFAL